MLKFLQFQTFFISDTLEMNLQRRRRCHREFHGNEVAMSERQRALSMAQQRGDIGQRVELSESGSNVGYWTSEVDLGW